MDHLAAELRPAFSWPSIRPFPFVGMEITVLFCLLFSISFLVVRPKSLSHCSSLVNALVFGSVVEVSVPLTLTLTVAV